MIKKSKEFRCEGYDCSISMTVDEAIAKVEEWLKSNIPGQMPLDTLATRYAFEIVVEELKMRRQEF